MIGYDWMALAFVSCGGIATMSRKFKRRAIGFALLASSNVFWFLFGLQVESSALTTMSVVFAVVNSGGCTYNILCLKKIL